MFQIVNGVQGDNNYPIHKEANHDSVSNIENSDATGTLCLLCNNIFFNSSLVRTK